MATIQDPTKTSASTAASETKIGGKKRGLRSPSYPYVSLPTAIDRAKAFYKAEGRNAARLDVAVTHWGLSKKSSGGQQTVAALSSFGLLSQEDGKIKLTDRAIRILLDGRPESPERDAALRQAALDPKIHSKLWERYGVDLPSDVNLKTTLVLDEKFNENTVETFLKEYKETLRFAKLLPSGSMPMESPESGDDQEASAMREIQEPWPNTAAAVASSTPPAREHEFFKGKVSTDLTIRVLATGQVTPRDIDKLVRMLTLQKEILDETN